MHNAQANAFVAREHMQRRLAVKATATQPRFRTMAIVMARLADDAVFTSTPRLASSVACIRAWMERASFSTSPEFSAAPMTGASGLRLEVGVARAANFSGHSHDAFAKELTLERVLLGLRLGHGQLQSAPDPTPEGRYP